MQFLVLANQHQDQADFAAQHALIPEAKPWQ